jgi:lipopolysaccharide transport system ATP-binding protein
MAMIISLCQRSLIMHEGNILMSEKTDKVVEKYISGFRHTSENVVNLGEYSRSAGNEKAIRAVWAENVNGEISSELLMGSEIKICFNFSMRQHMSNLAFGFGIEDMFGQRIFSMNNILSDNKQIAKAKCGKAVFDIHELPLLPGNYYVSLSIVQDQNTWIDYVERAFKFSVIPSDVFGSGRMLERSQGVVYVKGKVYVEN